jgi:hypothetical protein
MMGAGLEQQSTWRTVAPIVDRPSATDIVPSVARSITASAAQLKALRTASSSFGVGMGLGFGRSIPGVLAQHSPSASFDAVLSRTERIDLYRYFARSNPMVGRAIELHTELPLSRIQIRPPKGPSSAQNKAVNRIYEQLSDRIGLFPLLLEIAREYWTIGEVYLWAEWDPRILEWKTVYVLPVECMWSLIHPFNRKRELVFCARPLIDSPMARRLSDRDLYLSAQMDLDRLYDLLGESVPEELRDALNYGEAVQLNTDPSKGSYCIHLARNRNPTSENGESLQERCLSTLMRIENLLNAQFAIGGRNMNPKHLVCGQNIGADELADLRVQVDLAMADNSDYAIVTNYPVTWEVKGPQDRMLSLDAEYQFLLSLLATGLGTTVEMLTGQATYGGQRITVELMNTQYLAFRQLISDLVGEAIFRPVAEAKGHYYREGVSTWVKIDPSEMEEGDDVEMESDGTLRRRMVQVSKQWNHSSVGFSRLSIRDNAEIFDQLFQLHQKGSMSLRYLLELQNIDPDENYAAMVEDLGTINDPTFNEFLRSAYPMMAAPVVGQTDFIDRVVKGLRLNHVKRAPQAMPADGSMPLGGGGGGSFGLPPVGGDGSFENLGFGAETAPGAEAQPGSPGGGEVMDAGAGSPVTPASTSGPVAGRRMPPARRSGRRASASLRRGRKLSGSQVNKIVEAAQKVSDRGGSLSPVAVLRLAKREGSSR